MGNKKRIVILIVVVLFLSVGLSGCNETSGVENKLLGSWNIDVIEGDFAITLTYTFYKNGSVLVNMERITGDEMSIRIWSTYLLTSQQLCITTEGTKQCGTYEFSNNDEKLTIVYEGHDSEPQILTRA